MLIRHNLFIFTFFLLLFVAGDASATTYYVRTDGSDTCTGLQNINYAQDQTNCAWQTIPKAASTITAGDTVRVQGGTYVLNAQISIPASGVSFIGDNYPTIMQSNNDTTGFYVYNKNDVTISGLRMRNLKVGVYADYTNNLNISKNDIETIGACYTGRQGLSVGHSNNTYLGGNTINTTGGGISVWNFDYNYRNVTITNNTIDIPIHGISVWNGTDVVSPYCHDGGMAIVTGGTSAGCGPQYNPWNAPQVCGWAGENVHISYNKVMAANRNCIGPSNTRYVYIHDNWINDCDHNNIDLHGTADVLVYNNQILNGTWGEDSSILISAGYRGAHWVDAGAAMTFVNNITIYNNYINNQLLGGIFNWGNPINVTLYNNTIITNGKGMSWHPDPYVDFPRVVYGIRFIGNRIFGSWVTIGSDSFSLAPPQIPAFQDRNDESTIFLDNTITASQCFNFDNGNNDTYYFINNHYNCSSLYGYSTSSAIGNAYFGNFLNLHMIDEEGNPISDAVIAINSVDGDYSAYSLESVYDLSGFPTTGNRLLTPITASSTDQSGYSYLQSNYAKAIILPNHYARISNNYPNIPRQYFATAWQINVSKDGYYSTSFYHTSGLNDFKENKADRQDAITVVLYRKASQKLLIGDGGNSWETSTAFASIAEDKSKNSAELQQEISDFTSWWRFDENQRTGVYDFTGRRHGNIRDIKTNSGWATGKYGGGLKISTDKNYKVEFSNSTDFDPRNGNSVCYTMWVKPNSDWTDSTPHALIEKSDDNNIYGTGKGWQATKSGYATGQLFLRLTNGVPSSSYDVVCYGNDYNPCTKAWLKDEWHFTAMCFNLTAAKLKEDNLRAGIASNVFTSGSIESNYSFWIGKGINATIDDVRLYRRWLTDAEIDKVKNNTYKSSGNITTNVFNAESAGSAGDIWSSISVSADIPAQTSISALWNYSSDGISHSQETVGDIVSGQTYALANKAKYGSLVIQLMTADKTTTPVLYNLSLYSINAITAVPSIPLNIHKFDTSLPKGNIVANFTADTVNGNNVVFTASLKPYANYLIKKDTANYTITQADSTGRITFNNSVW